MDRSQATYEAFDGVELRLLNDRVVRCAALQIQEAVRYLRLLDTVSENFEAHHQFLAEFPGRIGIADVPLGDLGLLFEDHGWRPTEVTLEEALPILSLLAASEGGDPGAQADFLDAFPSAVGIEPGEKIPSELFEDGRTFTQEVYALVYGLASDFLTHLITSPRGQVTMMIRAAEPTERKLTPASTT